MTSQAEQTTKLLAEYKKVIDTDIKAYSQHTKTTISQQYGKDARLQTDAFLEILARGGKRIRGALTMSGYEMSGGKDRNMILQVARAVEMLHAYVLIIDDIQDRSTLRRGGPSAHVALAQYHRDNELAGDPEHFGVSIALNSALGGAHVAQMILANINAKEDLRLKVLSILSRTMTITSFGQTGDIVNEVSSEVSERNIEKVAEWKTAHYTFLNPLHMGMVLAGADCHATDAITDYAVHAGKAYQILDDISGTFGARSTTGKSSMEDVRSSKKTLLVSHALKLANRSDRNFVTQVLGDSDITALQFNRFKDILVKSGALERAKKAATEHIHIAKEQLQKYTELWTSEGVVFLVGLLDLLEARLE